MGGSWVGVLWIMTSVEPTVWLSVQGLRLHSVWSAWKVYDLWLVEG